MGDISVNNSQTPGVGFIPVDLAADLDIIDQLEDSIARNRPDLAEPADAFTDQLKNAVLSGKPVNAMAATGATNDLIALIEKHGLSGKIPANASLDDLRDPHTGLASLVDDPAAKMQINNALDRLDAALGGDAKLEQAAADLLVAGANGSVQGKDAHGADMQGKDAHGADKQGMRVEDTMLGLTAQDILSMPLDVQQKLLSQLSTSDLLIVANALKDKLDQIADSDGPIDQQELRDLLALATSIKDQLLKSAAVDGDMMNAANSDDGGMMDAGGSGSVGSDIITDGLVDDAIQDRKGDADVKGSGDAKSGGGGGGGKATIRGIAEALGRAIDDAYEALQAKADALGDDPSPSDAIDLQADSAVASALYKAAVEVINAVGKNINDGVRTRQ